MTLPSAPSPSSIVFWKTLPLRRAEAERDPVELAVAGDPARWVPKTHDFSLRSWRADEAQARVLADDELDDGVEQAVGARRRAYCSQTSASAPSSSTISTRQFSAVPACVWTRVEQRSARRAHAARDVDERAALPLRGVAGDERVVVARRRPSRGAARRARGAPRRLRERHDQRPRRGPVGASTSRVDLARARTAPSGASKSGSASAVSIAAAGRRRVRGQVEALELGELPAGLTPLNVRQRRGLPGARG